MKKIKKQINNTYLMKRKYDNEINKLEQLISPYLNLPDYSILYQEGDGICILFESLDEKHSECPPYNIPIRQIIVHIENGIIIDEKYIRDNFLGV